jgi:hypothetical protein
VARDQRSEQELPNKPRNHDSVSQSWHQALAGGLSEELQSGRDELSISIVAVAINSLVALQSIELKDRDSMARSRNHPPLKGAGRDGKVPRSADFRVVATQFFV